MASLTLQVDAAVSMLSVMLGSLGVERSSVGVNSSASVNNSAGVNSSAGVKAPPARLVSTTAPAAQDASASGVAGVGGGARGLGTATQS